MELVKLLLPLVTLLLGSGLTYVLAVKAKRDEAALSNSRILDHGLSNEATTCAQRIK